MPKIEPKNTWILIVSGLLALVLVSAVVLLDEVGAPINGVIRIGALLGYLMVFLASLSSNFMRELTKFFGRRFVKTHHVASVSALVALTIHAVAVAWRAGSLTAFLPVFTSWQAFLSLGGRPAFWLMAITSVTALFRTAIGKSWKTIHGLNYVAFVLGTVHALMIGSSFQGPALRILAVVMAVVLVVVFAVKRAEVYRRQQRRRARS